jgi:hypothetical protein
VSATAGRVAATTSAPDAGRQRVGESSHRKITPNQNIYGKPARQVAISSREAQDFRHSDIRRAEQMKSILFAAAALVAIGMASAHAEGVQDPMGNPVVTGLHRVVSQPVMHDGQRGVGVGGNVVRPLPNPTGQTWYGPHGEISLWDSDPNW